MYGSDHEDDGYAELYGSEGTPELNARFDDATRVHLAAILIGEVSIFCLQNFINSTTA